MRTDEVGTTPPRIHEVRTFELNARGGVSAREAAHSVAEAEKTSREARALARAAGKPVLSEATVIEYIDWVAVQLVAGHLNVGEAQLLFRGAELVISKHHATAQGKPTAHTDGLTDQG